MPPTNTIITGNGIGLTIDPRRPKDLTGSQLEEVRRDPDVEALTSQHDTLCKTIPSEYGSPNRAKESSLFKQHRLIKNQVKSLVKTRRRLLTQRVQAGYDAVAPAQDLCSQIHGGLERMDVREAAVMPPSCSFEGRARLTKTFTSIHAISTTVTARTKIIGDFMSLH